MTQLAVVSDNTGMVLYETMCKAIAECHRIDEVKDIRDKAVAFEKYSQQAKNKDNERLAKEIRLRAERKCGEISAKLPIAKTGGDQMSLRKRSPAQAGNANETKATILEHNKISTQQASDWERIASIPKKEFEEQLKEPKVSTKRLRDYAKSKEPPKPKPKINWRNPNLESGMKELDARVDLYDGLQRMVEGLKKVSHGLKIKDRALGEMSELNMELPTQIRHKIVQIKKELGKLAPLWLSICPCPYRNQQNRISEQKDITIDA